MPARASWSSMRRPKVDPIAAALAERPLPADREFNGRYRLDLRGGDLEEIARAVFERLKAARKTRDEAATARQRSAADERVQHWWRLYQELLP